jgi:tetratricopeptide (TPR) repeat protein
LATGSPNACNGCHLDQDADWADAALVDWFGDDRPAHYATAIHAGRTGAVDANSRLSMAAINADYPGIARATALSMLSQPHSSQDIAAVDAGLKNGDALIRIGALRALAGFPPEAQLEAALPLLSDPVRSVRLEAVRLVSPSRGSLPQGLLDRFAAAEREYIDAQLAIAERPEALGNLGNLFMEAGNAERALQFYQVALQLEPRAEMVRVNMADLYRQLRRDENAEALLRDGLALPGEHASLYHSLGLLLVRNQRQEEALVALEQAALLAPDNARYTFVLAIALNSLGQEEAAIEMLRDATERFPSDFEIGWSLVTMLRDSGQAEDARKEAVRLTERFPGNENAAALLQSLSAA